MLYTNELVSTQIGGMSLIGVGSERPTSWGNYFSLACGSRVVNFWAENLTSANLKFDLGGKVKIRRYQQDGRDHCLIDDERIPQDWYYNKLCFTGGYRPSLEVLQDMYSHVGDPGNELEQYTNPEKYWTDRGGTYRNGIVSMTVNATPRKLTATYTLEDRQELKT